MVTLDYLHSLPTPSFGMGFDRSAITDSLAAAIQRAVSGWRYTGRGRLARALNAIVETIWTYGEINESQALRTLGAFALAGDLDQLVATDGLIRRPGESDAALRRRWVESPVLLSVGTVARINVNAFDSLDSIFDAQAVMQPNRQNGDLYALKADVGLLTDDEWTTVLAYGNRRDQIIMGVEIHRGNPTIVPYSVALAVSYYSLRADETLLASSITDALKQYMADSRILGAPITASGIIAATLADPQTTPDITPTITKTSDSSTGNLAATGGTVYDGTVGAITFTRLTL